jgi:serine/threonine-protein kinase
MSTTEQVWLPVEFGPYTIFERLGVGGMATVHRAVHRETGREVALKRLLPQLAGDAALIKQFVREAEIARALAHPNIVGVEDFGKVGRERYLAMEYVRGQSVLQLLRRANEDAHPAPVGVATWVLHEILSALDFAMTGLDEDGNPFHIVHRDMSPSNIVLTREGVVKLIDFGVAKSLQGRYATNSGRIKGKLGYMPPEVLAGRSVDQRSDLYSTAIVTWELLTARRLFRGNENEQLMSRARKHERIPPSSINHWVPPELDELLAVALSEDPDERWPSAGAMQAALRPILDAQGDGASTEALAKWCTQLAIAEGVLEHSQTNHKVPLVELLRKKKTTTTSTRIPMPTRKLDMPGVRRFVDGVTTVVDEAFDPRERHRQVTESGDGELAAGSSDFPVGETISQFVTIDDEITIDPEFNDMGVTESSIVPSLTRSWVPKGER